MGENPNEQAGQPHDALIRELLSNPADAASELRWVLPPALVAQLDLDAMEFQPGTFIDDDLHRNDVDLLFRTTASGTDAYLYVLIEHQRTPDREMAYRMLNYQLRIWNQHRKSNKLTGGRVSPLPVIIPVVLYQGRRPWNAPTDIADLFDANQATRDGLGDMLPHVRYYLDDLTTVDVAALRARKLTATVELAFIALQRGPGDTDVTRWLADWTPEIRRLLAAGKRREVAAVFTYLQVVSTTQAERFHTFAATISQEAEDIAVTTGQQLIAQGRAQGRVEGRVEGLARLFLQSLELRYGTVPDQVRTRVTTATPEQIEAWNIRFNTTATTLDDIFA